MPTHFHFDHGAHASPIVLSLASVLAASLYLVGWKSLRRISRADIPGWRAASFSLGTLFVWVAAASPFAAYDHFLLTVHMIKHLLLLTAAPALILLGEAPRVCWTGMPRFSQPFLRRFLCRPILQWFARLITRPAFCWTASALTLLAWHLPVLFILAMQSEIWHVVQDTLFFVAGLLFWWPVIRPWPARSGPPRWSAILYLFFATLPCDVLSGFLAFSDRVVYPVYNSVPRTFGLSVLADQQCAAALMWTCVTILYLVPAVVISTKLLAPRTSSQHARTSG